MQHVKLNLPAVGTRDHARVDVGGYDLASITTNLSLRAGVGQVATLQVELALGKGTEVDGEMSVVVGPQTHAALLVLGWTPPQRDAN